MLLYRNELVLPDNNFTYSIDSLRLSASFSRQDAERIYSMGETFMPHCASVDMFHSGARPGRFRQLFVYNFEEPFTSLTLGVGHFNQGCSLDERKGFIDFNPNKCPDYAFDFVSSFAYALTLKRFDLAVDVPESIKNFVLINDLRSRKSIIGRFGSTFYLGSKGSPGHFKMYDKTKESSLSFPLTRCELTCDGSWSPSDVVSHWPSIVRPKFAGSRNSRALVKALELLAANELDTSFVLNELDKRARDRIALSNERVLLDLKAVASVIDRGVFPSSARASSLCAGAGAGEGETVSV